MMQDGPFRFVFFCSCSIIQMLFCINLNFFHVQYSSSFPLLPLEQVGKAIFPHTVFLSTLILITFSSKLKDIFQLEAEPTGSPGQIRSKLEF